jgi:hypothetical protein
MIATSVDKLLYHDQKSAAIDRLKEIAEEDWDSCLATAATSAGEDQDMFSSVDFAPWNSIFAVTAAGGPEDRRPCKLCEDDKHQETMILCDKC